ncbi:MAG: dehydrogenase [Candidatus Latescibacteria bacterium]|jgi:phosphoglycerate dehydrogenase-like enzyme|nr:dehydrogenase [Candidatus Latescibacterota bacterium]
MKETMRNEFQVGLVADLRNSSGQMVFEDFGLEGLDAAGLPYHFLEEDNRPVNADQLEGVDAVISMGQPYVPSSFHTNSRLSLIARTGVGYEMVDLDAATEADVMVTITPSATRRPVASATLALILGLCHRVVIKDRIVRENRWDDRFHHMGCEIRDRVVGLVGLGHIAREVVTLLPAFSPSRIIACDPAVNADQAQSLGVELVSFETLLKDSDFVSIHCPLTTHTQGLIGAPELRLMKETAFVVNTARGPIIDQSALTTALQHGWIQGAALDVFTDEPPVKDDPLLSMDNVILGPHSSAWTYELFRDIGHDCVAATCAVAKGEIPEHVVNSAVLERPGLKAKLQNYKEQHAQNSNR